MPFWLMLFKDDNREEAWKKEIDNLDKESTQLPKFLADIRDANKNKPKIINKQIGAKGKGISLEEANGEFIDISGLF